MKNKAAKYFYNLISAQTVFLKHFELFDLFLRVLADILDPLINQQKVNVQTIPTRLISDERVSR